MSFLTVRNRLPHIYYMHAVVSFLIIRVGLSFPSSDAIALSSSRTTKTLQRAWLYDTYERVSIVAEAGSFDGAF